MAYRQARIWRCRGPGIREPSPPVTSSQANTGITLDTGSVTNAFRLDVSSSRFLVTFTDVEVFVDGVNCFHALLKNFRLVTFRLSKATQAAILGRTQKGMRSGRFKSTWFIHHSQATGKE